MDDLQFDNPHFDDQEFLETLVMTSSGANSLHQVENV